jgi:hypothetical protein
LEVEENAELGAATKEPFEALGDGERGMPGEVGAPEEEDVGKNRRREVPEAGEGAEEQ